MRREGGVGGNGGEKEKWRRVNSNVYFKMSIIIRSAFYSLFLYSILEPCPRDLFCCYHSSNWVYSGSSVPTCLMIHRWPHSLPGG